VSFLHLIFLNDLYYCSRVFDFPLFTSFSFLLFTHQDSMVEDDAKQLCDLAIVISALPLPASRGSRICTNCGPRAPTSSPSPASRRRCSPSTCPSMSSPRSTSSASSPRCPAARRSSRTTTRRQGRWASSAAGDLDDHHKIRCMRRALNSSDVELVKLMVMGEGLNLDEALALHYAVENCSSEVVKVLLELSAADVNC
jgi:hypothetical protein